MFQFHSLTCARSLLSVRRWKSTWVALAILTLACTRPSPPEYRPASYDIEINLNPTASTLNGRVVLNLTRLDPTTPPNPTATVDLELHESLDIDSIEATGATIKSRTKAQGEIKQGGRIDATIKPTIHRLVLDNPADAIELTLDYSGRLLQDVELGETEDLEANFTMFAHIAEEGIFLDPDGYWYPRIELGNEADPTLTLADYRLTVEEIKGVELVAGLERTEGPDGERFYWTSPHPLRGVVLLGGPLLRWSAPYGDMRLHAILAPYKAAVARDILTASTEYLERYEPLLGPFPFSEYKVLESFFTSEFVFPTCTQIVGLHLTEFKQYRRHGYLDRGLLQNWFGDGVLNDPRGGEWSSAINGYLGNYYGYVLDGDETGARKHRRNISNFLSPLDPDLDRPLANLREDNLVGETLGNQKGTAVMHMLARKIGADAFFGTLRRLAAERMGQYTTWADVQRLFEEESGRDLSAFFDQWVNGTGSPLLDLTEADWSPGSDEVRVTIEQGESDFVVDVPLRLHYGDRFDDVVVTVDEPRETVTLPCERSGLTAVELDPDYHVFRRLKPEELMLTTLVTRRTDNLVIVALENDGSPGYRAVIDVFTEDVLGNPQQPREGHHVNRITPEEFSAEIAAGKGVLVLGEAVRAPSVQAFLGGTRSPIDWLEDGFAVDGESYTGPEHAVLATMHHPDGTANGITVYYGNSEDALANAEVLAYYTNSLLVYDTPVSGESEGRLPSGMPHTQVIHRVDLEYHDRIEF